MNLKHLVSLVAATAAMLPLPAFSTPAEFVLTGLNGQVVIGEYGSDLVPGQTGHYYVDILASPAVPPVSLYGFAVSTFAGVFADTDRAGWDGFSIMAADWDAGYQIGTAGPLTTSLGLFASFFGDAAAANLYFNTGGASDNMVEGTDQDQDGPGSWSDDLWDTEDKDGNKLNRFWFNAAAASHFVAFNSTSVVDQSHATSVPDAGSTLALTAFALAGLTGASRRWLR